MPERRPIESDWLKESALASVSISPDESMLAGLLLDGRVRVHQFPEGEVLWTSDVVHAGGGDDNEFKLAFSPDGTMLATGSRDKKLFLWDVKSGVQLDAQATDTWVRDIVFSTAGTKLALTGDSGRTTLWDVFKRSLVNPKIIQTEESRCLAFSPNDSMLAVGLVDRSVRLYDSETLSPITRLLHASYPTSVVFNPNGEELAAASRDGVYTWDKAFWANNDTRPGSTHWHLTVDVSPSGTVARPVDIDGGYAVSIWNPSTGEERVISEVLPKDSMPHPPAVAFSPDGSILAIGGDDGILRLHDLSTGQQSEHQLHDRRIYSVAFSPDGALVASAGRGPALEVLEVESGKLLDMPEAFQSHEDAVWVRFSKDGRLAAGGGDWDKYGELRVWEFINGQPNLILKTHHSRIVRCLDFSPDGERIVVIDDLNSARFHVYELSSGEKVLDFRGQTKTMSVIFSSDGQRLITGSDDASIRFWDASSGERLGKLQTKGRVRALAVSPDGDAFVSANTDGFVRIWRAAPSH